MKAPHKHAELIKAWADGAEIQYKDPIEGDYWWSDTDPEWWRNNIEFRIKPEPKPDVVKYFYAEISSIIGIRFLQSYSSDPQDIKATFDGETNKIKSVEIVK